MLANAGVRAHLPFEIESQIYRLLLFGDAEVGFLSEHREFSLDIVWGNGMVWFQVTRHFDSCPQSRKRNAILRS